MTNNRFSMVSSITRLLLAGCLVLCVVNALPSLAVQASVGSWSAVLPMNAGRYGHTATLLVSGPQNGKVLVVGGNLEVTLPGDVGLSDAALDAAQDADPAGQTAELFDPANLAAPWSLTASMNVPRVFHTATWIGDGKVLVAGGANSISSNSLYTAEIYDPVGGAGDTPIWTLTQTNMAHAHVSATATRLDDGRVVIAGGYSGSVMSGDATNTVEIFDPVSGTWSSAAPMNQARSYHTATLIHPAGATYGKVLVVGGSTAAYSSTGQSIGSVEIYDPSANTWTVVQPLNLARSDHSAVLLENGKVLVVGGYSSEQGEDESYLASVEVYDPDSNTWTGTTPLSTARGNHTATLLENGPQNGKVLVAGGANSTSSVISTEIYDPAVETWADAGNLQDPYGGRVSHTATLLTNGQVLAAGGFLGIGNDPSADASAEVYMPLLSQTITVSQNAPANAAYQSTFTVAATAPGGTVTYSSGSPAICTVALVEGIPTFTMLSGTGVCLVQYDQAGSEVYAAAPRITQEVNAQKIDQSITISAGVPLTAAYKTTFQVAATASSSLGVVYSSASLGICTVEINAGIPTFTMLSGTGDCLVKYDQPGNNNYNPAPQKSSTITAEKIDQNITFSISGTRPYGSYFSVSGITDSDLPITFSVGDDDPCEVISSAQDPQNPAVTNASIHPTGLGSCIITAAQDGDPNYNSAYPVVHTVTIVKGDQTITVTRPSPTTAAYNTTFTVAATGSSGLDVVYSSDSPTICSNIGAEFTILAGSGTCLVNYDQGGNAYYNAAPTVAASVTAVKANQTISVNPHAPATAAYDTHFTVAGTAPAGTVTYSSGSPGICSVLGGEFTMLAASGTCLVQFDQGGNGYYNPASQVIESVSAVKAGQTISVNPHAPASAAYQTAFTVAATAPGGSVAYSSGSPAVCSNSGAEFTMLSGTGTCVVRFDQAGNSNYLAAPRVIENVSAEKIDQNLVFSITGERPYGADFTVSASTDSNLPIEFHTGTGDPCEISGTSPDAIDPSVTNATVHPTGLGACTISAAQTGDENYNPGSTVDQTISIVKGSQVITVTKAAPAASTYQSAFTVSATAPGGAVTYSSGSPTVCSSSGAEFTMLSGTGECLVQFDQVGDDLYNPAPRKTNSVTAQKIGQAITFELAEDQFIFGDADITIAAVSDSGLPVTLNLAPGDPCTLTANTLHIEHAGSCTITSLQAGDDNYLAAAPVSHQITILKKTTSITLSGLTCTIDHKPKMVTATPAVAGLTVIITYTGIAGTLYDPSTQPPVMIGTYAVNAEIDDHDYQGSATGTMVINPVRVYLPAINAAEPAQAKRATIKNVIPE